MGVVTADFDAVEVEGAGEDAAQGVVVGGAVLGGALEEGVGRGRGGFCWVWCERGLCFGGNLGRGGGAGCGEKNKRADHCEFNDGVVNGGAENCSGFWGKRNHVVALAFFWARALRRSVVPTAMPIATMSKRIPSRGR